MRPTFSLLLLLLLPNAAHAEWIQASSANFVVYADDTEHDIRKFSDQLERYHAALAFLTTRNLPAPSPSNRVTVYVVKDDRTVRRLHGGNERYLNGFYIPRAGGSLAIVPAVNAARGEVDLPMITLLHEYAHHFAISSSAVPLPRWLSEGQAEFFASASFSSNGGVSLGRPAMHRGWELFNAREVKVADLLDPAAYEARRSNGYDAFYGKSWLLFHYLVFNQPRQGQMEKYLVALTSGKSLRDAALEAFGDFEVLDGELDRYLAQSRMIMLTLKPGMLHVSAVEVRRMSPGEAAMMPVRIRSRRGVDEDQAQEVIAEARAVATRFPGDAAVLAALAEAEYDAGHDAEAIAAADAALTIDRNQANAYVQKGLALFRMAETSSDSNAYTKARAPFVALNRIENDHPLPLIYYYYSFVRQGRDPSPLAIQGLERAVDVAPFDLGLRMTLAMEQLRGHRPAEARTNLAPIAFNPHAGGLADHAKDILQRLDREPGWDGSGLAVPGPQITDDQAK